MKKIGKFKKITGSRFGAVLGVDNFKSPFQLWCEMMGFYMDEPNTFFLDAGKIIEPKLKFHAEKKTGKKFQSYDPNKIKYDLFSHNEIFGGIPDGEEFDENGNVISILEIKTAQLDKYKWDYKDNQYTLNLENNGQPTVMQTGGGLIKWFKNGHVIIPESYMYQLALYLYLRGIEQGYFCVGFIKTKDYQNPSSIKFSSEFNNYLGYDEISDKKLGADEHILIWKPVTIHDIKNIQEKINRAEKWYRDHIIGGFSPEMTTQDLTWFRYGYPSLQ